MGAMPNKDAIREWLFDYIWGGPAYQTPSEAELVVKYKNNVIECIFSQDTWQYLDVRIEKLMSQRSGERTVREDMEEALGLELSSLYECHEGPHLPTCPMGRVEHHEG
jgi:hypothetical protein